MTHYRGRNSIPGYHCAGKDLVNGRGVYCLNVGGLAIEQAVAGAFLEAITPGAIEVIRLSVGQLQANHDAALSQWRLEVERAQYEAERAERHYRTVEPENRLVARGLETEWENRLRDLAKAEMELRHGEQQRPNTMSPEQFQRMQTLGSDISQVWTATATTDRDRKETAVHLAGGSDSESQASRRSRASDSALAGRGVHHVGCSRPTIQADGAAHRRRYDLIASAPGQSLSG